MANTLDIQRRLLALGYSPGPLDGLMGRKTIAAVKSFQARHDLHVDGIVGPITLAALNAAGGIAPSLPSLGGEVIPPNGPPRSTTMAPALVKSTIQPGSVCRVSGKMPVPPKAPIVPRGTPSWNVASDGNGEGRFIDAARAIGGFSMISGTACLVKVRR